MSNGIFFTSLYPQLAGGKNTQLREPAYVEGDLEGSCWWKAPSERFQQWQGRWPRERWWWRMKYSPQNLAKFTTVPLLGEKGPPLKHFLFLHPTETYYRKEGFNPKMKYKSKKNRKFTRSAANEMQSIRQTIESNIDKISWRLITNILHSISDPPSIKDTSGFTNSQ